MSEMLGNQYFLVGRYYDAIKELENALVSDPSNNQIKKKLIICYIKTNEIEKAFDIFNQLINLDISFILESNNLNDNCPCSEIIYELENANIIKDQNQNNLALGMMWLFFNAKNSINYFQKVLGIESIKLVIKLIENSQKQINHVR
jgi:pentatricopeptide repeat protein